jgi:glycerol-3-phosphate acyltransferase PlsX
VAATTVRANVAGVIADTVARAAKTTGAAQAREGEAAASDAR